ncbi:MAG: glycoside hydrolase, partial [Chloroflexi bacterium]|nr:glycoside hydrolase [Chloroflexota bacterium]
MDHSQFKTPPNQYRELPFWSWNDDLDPAEVARQVKLFAHAGWGGFFIHARSGLKTPYLSEQWMACVGAAVDAAKEHGLTAWLYDEDKWPSGFAGGLSVAANPAHRMMHLFCSIDDKPALIAERIAMFQAREVEGELIDIRPVDTPSLQDSADRLIQFYPQHLPLGIGKFNGYSYLSMLDPEAVRGFIETTHEAYKAHLGAHFGSTIPGIFTDEPAYLTDKGIDPSQVMLPWTDELPRLYQERSGRDLLPELASLFFDVGDYHQVRYEFWATVTQRFVDSYTKQIADWCAANHLKSTGHLMHEDTLTRQVERIGSAMQHYAHMHIPGVDNLARTINEGWGTVLTLKQLDSVVSQMGKERALVENYGASGYDFAHHGRKWIGEWAYVLGANLNNPHLAAYSLRGARKR